MRRRAGGASRCAAVLTTAVAFVAPAAAQTVVALSSNGVRAPLEALMTGCAHAAGAEVSVTYGTSASIRQRVTAGEAVDVVLATDEVVAELAKAGRVVTASVTPLGRAGIGLGIRAGSRRFEIGTPDALERALLSARSVAYAQDGASRVHIERVFDRLGIAAEMKAKTLLEQGSARAAAKVVAGEAEILLTLVSEILPVEGMELLGPLPAELQSYISFAAAVGVHAASAERARSFIGCVAAPAAAPAFRAEGIER
jgi:molybdate transport system substrate-binding protein